ncbi:MAG: hypothetical protein MRJ65_01605 [Candidatus Brocadiaceae bacterium]|nr:hypothetical protein [Candidatus Brocadiaceae bacterium]
MGMFVKAIVKFLLFSGAVCLMFFACLNAKSECAEAINGDMYHEIIKDGRIYVFTSSQRKADFEKSGELGKGIIKVGYGQKGETVVFDSDEAVKKYDARHCFKGQKSEDKVSEEVADEKGYFEFQMDGRIYVFTSSGRKETFESSGELGKGLIRIGRACRGNGCLWIR